MMKPTDRLDNLDHDDDGELDVEWSPLPAGLLAAAGVETDEDWEALGNEDKEDKEEVWAAQRAAGKPERP